MHGDLGEHVGRVYVDPLSLAVDAARRLVVPAGHAEPPPLAAHEAVEADLALGAEAHRDLGGHLDLARRRQARGRVDVGGNRPGRPAPPVGLRRAPLERPGVEVGDVGEGPPGDEVALREPDEPLGLALGVGAVGLAQPRLEPHAPHERLYLVTSDLRKW